MKRTSYITAPQAAAILGIELRTIYRYVRRGILRGVKQGRCWQFASTDIDALARRERANGAAARPALRLVSGPQLLTDILTKVHHVVGERGGVSCGHERLSYAQINRLAERLAGGLHRMGVRAGERVVVLLPNSIDFIVSCFAIWKVRGIVVADGNSIKPGTLRHILNECQPRAIIADGPMARQVEALRAEGDLWRVLVGCAEPAANPPHAWEYLDRILSLDIVPPDEALDGASPDDVVSLTYTSGSTGMPKGVMHTHASWIDGAEFTRAHAGLRPLDKIVIPLPLYHAYAMRQVLAYMLAGASIVLADVYQALKLLDDEKPTALLLVPTACNILIDHFSNVLRDADGMLRYVEIGSAAMPAERLERLRQLLPSTDVYLPYGLTEARVGFLKAGPDGLLNTLTEVAPGLELRVLDHDGRPAKRGETGEIVLRGRGLMHGYWNWSDADNAAMRRDGFRTGDLARVQRDGQISLVGRIDDVLKIGGRKVIPNEVEMTLNRHPAVIESAAVAVADPKGILEHVLHAFVALRDGASPSEAELMTHCRQYLESYKLPARIHFRTSLPKSPVGKILRRALVLESMVGHYATNGGSEE
ncbi:MAG: Long-chain-fatty-acid--CoA ligase [Phycisphaerae bacterium]|nr:Long-chain-fatty-acid--CoA ligase [Phycisphaerae bacterium]